MKRLITIGAIISIMAQPLLANKLKNPEEGKPGAVAFGVFMAKLDPKKPFPVPEEAVSVVSAEYSEIVGNKYVRVSSKENVDHTVNSVYIVETNLEAGKEYIVDYIQLRERVGQMETIFDMNLNNEATRKLFTIKPEPGKIKFLGVYCICMVVEKSENVIMHARGNYVLMDGYPILAKMEGAKYPHSTYIMWLKQSVFWKEVQTPVGAERNFFDQFMKRNKKVSYWYNLAATRREELGYEKPAADSKNPKK